MIKILMRMFLKNAENIDVIEKRTKYSIFAGVLGIVCNVFLFLLKSYPHFFHFLFNFLDNPILSFLARNLYIFPPTLFSNLILYILSFPTYNQHH